MKRRNFIRISTFAAGAWLIADMLPPAKSAAATAELHFSPHPLLKFFEDGKVIIYVTKQEMGQNVSTSLPLIIAEELEMNLKEIAVETLPYQASASGDYTTWASASVKESWIHLRQVGAMAKTMLMTAAAMQWKVPVAKCIAQDGKVINSLNKASLPYKDLIRYASALPLPENVVLKETKNFKHIGQKVPRTNISAIVTGKHTYTMDIKLPDMLYATLIRCPVFNGKLDGWDISALTGLYGFVKAVPIKQVKEAQNRDAVAIIATNSWAALEGRRLIKVKWGYELGVVKDSESLTARFKSEISSGNPSLVISRDEHAPFEALRGSDVFTADYEVQYLAHATMEPVNCTAWYKDRKFEIWGGFQAPMYISSVLSKYFDIDQSSIMINLMPMGGSFGRKEKIDNVLEAMLLTKTLGKPVQVLFSRTDDLQADFYRPATYHRLSAIVTAGNITKWRHQQAVTTFPEKEITGPWFLLGGVANDLSYPVGDCQNAFYPVESLLPVGSWRSIGFSQNVFAIESFIDELAVYRQTDPVQFRYNLFKDNQSEDVARLKNVLSKCADKIGWEGKPEKGHFRGIACCAYGHANSFAAHALEISVGDDKLVKIHRCVAAIDCGFVIDPDGLKAQIEGSMAWALSGIFKNEIIITNGVIDQSSFADYQVLRMNEMPPFEIMLIKGSNTPGGGGEPGVPSVGPALCNAIYSATGIRVRNLPVKNYGFRLV